jgi:hypothetical protein
MKTELYNKYKDTFETERIKPSYISMKVERFKSPIHGVGMCACEKIQKDEVLFIKGGWELLREEMASSGPANSYTFPDGKITMKGFGMTLEGTFKTSGKNIITAFDGLNEPETIKYTLQGDTLTLEADGVTTVLTKK